MGKCGPDLWSLPAIHGYRDTQTLPAPCHPWRCSNLEHRVRVMVFGHLSPGRPEEFHHQPPTEPCVNLSIYTARTSHSFTPSRLQNDAESKCSSRFPSWQKLPLN